MHRRLLKLLLFCLASLCCSPSSAQIQYYYTLKAWNIKGKVDSIIQNEIKIYKNDSINTTIYSRAVFIYNNKGHLLEERYHDYAARKRYILKDTLPLRVVRTYDKKGTLLEKVRYDSGGQPSHRDVFTFNPSASVIEYKSYYEPTKAMVTIAKLALDKEGNIIETKSFNTRGKLEYHHKYQYDEQNNCIEDIEVSQVTMREDKSVFIYDNGNLIKRIDYLDFGETQSTVIYTYNYPKFDKMNNWTIRKMYYNGRLSQIDERAIVYRK